MEEKQTDVKRVLYSILAGCTGGILSAVLVILMIRLGGYTLNALKTILLIVLISVLPVCLEGIGGPLLLPWVSCILQIALSCTAGILFAMEAGGDPATVQTLLRMSFVLHVPALIINAVRLWLRKENR